VSESPDAFEDVELLAARARAERERILESARRIDAGAAEERFIAAARPLLAPARRRSAPIALLAAAAVLLAFAAWFMHGASDAPPSGQPIELGTGLVEPLVPTRAGSTFDVFEWRVTRDAPARYLLIVRTEDGRELLRVRDLREPRYRPTAAEVASWPEHIRWRIAVLDATGETIDAASARASRSP
jgi:hypothetical protein